MLPRVTQKQTKKKLSTGSSRGPLYMASVPMAMPISSLIMASPVFAQPSPVCELA